MTILQNILIISGIALICIALFESVLHPFDRFHLFNRLIEWLTEEIVARILPIWDDPINNKGNYISRLICFILGVALIVIAWKLI
ncbi:MAG: hypothetical protein IKZ88_08380 [Neisseriaceae bacterium]|nr:hypothetical protein [Neisseriaceae bacterium]MBR5941262.1 hypothetical protein [Neisseriaceae bacterium]